MTRRNVTRPWILAAGLALVLTGCHVILGPDEGEQSWWYYCDDSGCYECDRDGCDIPGNYCYDDSECPSNWFCDPKSHSCRSNPTCKVTADCLPGYVCTSGKCGPARTPCTDHENCGTGAYCSNGTCKNSDVCSGDSDCAKLGNFVCQSGTCVPGTPIATCQSAGSCSDGLCVNGQCGTCSGDCGGGTTCEFNKHCGTDRVCLDGKCVSSCTDSTDCASGQVCKSKVCVSEAGSCVQAADCASGQACVNNTCLETCTSGGQCSSSLDTCSPAISVGSTSVAVCIPDTSAQLECKVSNDCTGGEVCVNGICRTSCSQTSDCAACDDGPVCGQGGFCMTASEADPKCAKSSECSGGQYCLDAQCVSL